LLTRRQRQMCIRDRFEGIEALPKRVQVMKADVAQIKAYIAHHCDAL
jgi:hypothetical protein